MVDLWPGDREEIAKYQRLLVALVEAAEKDGLHCVVAVERAKALRERVGEGRQAH